MEWFLTPAPKDGVIDVACAVRTAVGIKLAGVPTDETQWFQIFRKCSSPKDLELIRFWGVSINNYFHGKPFSDIFGSYILFVAHRQNPSIDFHQIFRTYLAPNDLGLIRSWGVSGINCYHGNTLQFGGFLSLVSIPQTKPMLKFTLNLQDGFTTKGSKADFGKYPVTTVAMATLSFWGLGRFRFLWSLNICMNFHQIFSKSLPSEDLKFNSFLFRSSKNGCLTIATLFKVLGYYKVLNSPWLRCKSKLR